MADADDQLSRRERQIMDVLYARGELSPAQLAENLPDPPTPTAARTMLRNLMDEGFVQRRKEGREYLYRPTTAPNRAGRSALERVVDTFFGGSLDQALSAYLGHKQDDLSEEELKRLAKRIRDARRRGN